MKTIANTRLCIIISTVILIIFMLVGLMARSQEISFTRHMVDESFEGPAGIFIADIDGDGYKDIISAGIDGNEVAWWRNGGEIQDQWSKQTIDDAFGGAIYVYAEDLNGDTHIDIIAAGYRIHQIVWYENTGNYPIFWTKHIIDNSFLAAHEVCACDVDKDGEMDVLGAGAAANSIAYYHNDGGAHLWTKQIIDDEFMGARSIDAKDLDGDGDIDLAGAALDLNEIAWYRNNGGNPINWEKISIDNSFGLSHKVVICQGDNNQGYDLLGTGYAPGEIAFWFNNGENPPVWLKQTVDNTFHGAVIAYAGDLENDGDCDIVGTAQGSNQVAIWRNNNGNPIEWEKISLDQGYSGAWPMHMADIDEDKDIDIAAGANDGHYITWYENNLYGVSFNLSQNSGHAPLEILFTDNSHFETPIIFRGWDFDGDGEIDSNEENPSWTYNEPGYYTVSLMIQTDSLQRTVIHQNLVHVFNGESAIEFNGEDSYVEIAADPSIAINNSFTVEAWIKPNGFGEMVNVGMGRIIEKSYLSIFLIKGYGSLSDSSLVIQMTHDDGTISRVSSPAHSITLNQWQHIAVSYDATQSNLKVYLNGIEQELTVVTAPSGPVKENIDKNLYIGNASNNSWTFQGIIDDVRIWEKVLLQQEIVGRMDNFLTGNENGLIVYYKFDEGWGDNLYDEVGENNGAAINTSWIEGKPLDPITGIEHNKPLPKETFSVYPVPVSRKMHIYLSLEQKDRVRISLYDIQGKLVTDVLDQQLAAGDYNFTYELRNERMTIPAGIYFCKLNSKYTNNVVKILIQ